MFYITGIKVMQTSKRVHRIILKIPPYKKKFKVVKLKVQYKLSAHVQGFNFLRTISLLPFKARKC